MGKVYLVGAGPGDPDLLTVRAVRILRTAHVVLHDALVSSEVLNLANPAALIPVGKRCGRASLPQEDINRLLVSYAARKGTVVRLKGGDPLIFGRGGEEIDALRVAGIEFEIVPGITCALAAAAAAGIPLTDRRCASQVLFTTAYHAPERNSIAGDEIMPHQATVVVYMPGHDYCPIAQSLLDAGYDPSTPCLIVSHASRPDQQLCRTDLAGLRSQAALPAPALLILGWVAQRPGMESERGVELDSTLQPDFVLPRGFSIGVARFSGLD
jgi:uroporphyrin-III C-methyltransferase